MTVKTERAYIIADEKNYIIKTIADSIGLTPEKYISKCVECCVAHPEYLTNYFEECMNDAFQKLEAEHLTNTQIN